MVRRRLSLNLLVYSLISSISLMVYLQRNSVKIHNYTFNIINLVNNIKAYPDRGYIHKLEKLFSGFLVPCSSVQSYQHTQGEAINLGLVLINTGLPSTSPDFRSDEFVYKSVRNLKGILALTGDRPIHFIIVTNPSSGSWAGQIISYCITRRLSLDIIQERWFRWRNKDRLPPLKFSLVDSEEILNLNPDFIQGLFDNREPSTAEKNKYSSTLFYVAPLYHLAFKSLEKLLVIDSSDLEFLVDIAELYDEFNELEKDKKAIMSLGLDLAPHYYNQLGKYRRIHPNTEIGKPGRFQGFNTGVVLYRLDRMRESEIYNKFLSSDRVSFLTKKFMYKISLAEQDFFTNLGFIHPELFNILPCTFNKQESIQYLAPPFEEIFDLYHDCKEKKDVKVYHINGCGPTLELCKHQDMPGSRLQGDKTYHFFHANFEVFWE
ncbi:uncharacterized protein LOC111699263 [Eurytemora carolleeae]|uniref:uncharacterized protein LOC111699263 n=1 Tax=Eurytemora carolleeae TaxID=1294199 RepID=UPI000C7935D3|nr:uncharacterized protein LOC111699263 [Eurytemora carolleeae]|eukprot:XP_023325652.1 uncharacterized protein LOC111699263 [Eurytemora affinis]